MKIDVATQSGYVLATALRGPDFSCEFVKFILTGPIRCMVRVGGVESLVIMRSGPLLDRIWDEDVDSIIKADRAAMAHYLDHCFAAFMVLRDEHGYNTQPFVDFIGNYFSRSVVREGKFAHTRQILQELITAERESDPKWWEQVRERERDEN